MEIIIKFYNLPLYLGDIAPLPFSVRLDVPLDFRKREKFLAPDWIQK
jgi:hypothetical protein